MGVFPGGGEPWLIPLKTAETQTSQKVEWVEEGVQLERSLDIATMIPLCKTSLKAFYMLICPHTTFKDSF